MEEVRTLQLHPQAIFTYIRGQAGSLGKAIAEMVMNSFDAFASEVHIECSSNAFSVTDDGMGIRDKAEISAWFETLGFPHDEGNHRTWGKYGLGRAQAWAFASTVWYSNQFIMDVDVKNRGLDYRLSIAPSARKGTRIEAKLYHAISLQEQNALKLELRELLRYVGKPVYMNGQLISEDPALAKWDIETPEAWISLTPSKPNQLTVYNAGVLVASYMKYRFGVVGVVVTKPDATLLVNVARNDILVSECKVWPKVLKAFPAKSAPKPKPEVTSRFEVERLKHALHAGSLTLKAVFDDAPDLLKTIRGRRLKLDDVCGWRVTSVLFASPKNLQAKAAARSKDVLALDDSVLTRLDLSIDQFRDRLRATMASQSYLLSRLDSQAWTTDPLVVCPWLESDSQPMALADYSPLQRDARSSFEFAFLQAARLMQTDVLTAKPNSLSHLKVHLGTSTSQEIWVAKATAESGVLLVLREDVAVKALNGGLASALLVLTKAYRVLLAHIADDATEAKALEERMLFSSQALGTAAAGLLAKYSRLRTDRGEAGTRSLLASIEAINPVEPEALHEASGTPDLFASAAVA